MKRYRTKIEFVNAEQFLVEELDKWKDYIEISDLSPMNTAKDCVDVYQFKDSGSLIFDKDWIYLSDSGVPNGVCRDNYFQQHYILDPQE
jgi:hypothetical protein